MKMEQIMEHSIPVIGGLEVVIRNNQAKIGAEIKIIQEMVDSLAFRIDTNQEKMDANLEIIAEKRRWPAKKRQRPVWRVRSQPQWRQSPSWSIKKSLKNRPQRKLSEHSRSGIGSGIWP
jgi:hypothetical protein